jgi:hypothetical protein
VDLTGNDFEKNMGMTQLGRFSQPDNVAPVAARMPRLDFWVLGKIRNFIS